MLTLRSSLLAAFVLIVALPGAPLRAANPDEISAAAVATTFLKDYLAKGSTDYFLRSPIVSPAAKTALKKILAAAHKAEPELGLGHDPVLQGQDHADEYRVTKVVVTGDTATADGVAKGWPAIPLRLARGRSGWLIDGAGEINLPRGR